MDGAFSGLVELGMWNWRNAAKSAGQIPKPGDRDFVGPLSKDELFEIARSVEGQSPELGRKLEYLFGNATGRQHNIDRTKRNVLDFAGIGINDTLANRDYLSKYFQEILNDSRNILDVELTYYIAKELPDQPTIYYIRTTRESLIKGPDGG